MEKFYSDDPVKCTATGVDLHQLTYMGQIRDSRGQLQRSLEYRCSACGEFISKKDLQEATQNA